MKIKSKYSEKEAKKPRENINRHLAESQEKNVGTA